MSDSSQRTFSSDFKKFFLRGLVVLLPSVLTLWIVVKAYQFVDNTIAEPINRGTRTALVNLANYWEPLRDYYDPTAQRNPVWRDAMAAHPDWSAALSLPSKEQPPELVKLRKELRAKNITTWWRERWYMDLIGIIVAIVAVYIAGRLLGGFFGRRIYRRLEGMLTSVPVFKQVYPYVKQIVDFIFSSEQPMKFNRVVAVEYPRKGIWSVGFLTGSSLRALDRIGNAVTIFIPSSPTPFTGYTITVPGTDVIELPLTVEEAIRFAVSGGVLVPAHQRPEGLEGEDLLDATGLIPIPPEGETTAPETPEPDVAEESPAPPPSDSTPSSGRSKRRRSRSRKQAG